MSDRHSSFDRLDSVSTAVTALIEGDWPDEGGDVADLTGGVRHQETRLADFRRLLLSETPAETGEAYKVQESRKANRTYNTPRILSDLMTSMDNPDMLGLIFELMRSGALKLTWGWTKLEGEFEKRNVPLVKGYEELDEHAVDLEQPHVGEVWETYTRVVAK